MQSHYLAHYLKNSIQLVYKIVVLFIILDHKKFESTVEIFQNQLKVIQLQKETRPMYSVLAKVL